MFSFWQQRIEYSSSCPVGEDRVITKTEMQRQEKQQVMTDQTFKAATLQRGVKPRDDNNITLK